MVYTRGDDRSDWDDANVEHIERHAVSPDEAEDVVLDPDRFVYPAQPGSERRLAAIGATDGGRILAVVFASRHGRWRVVTAREANRWQKRQYRKSRGKRSR